MDSRNLGVLYDITPNRVHEIVRVPSPALKSVDTRRYDVFPAAEVPHLSGVFRRLTQDGMSPHDLAVVVKIPKAARKARQRAMLAMGL